MANSLFFLFLGFTVFSTISGLDYTQNSQNRGKRGAAVYITFPTQHTIQAPVSKNPQDFINAIGGNNGYAPSGGYGGGLASQFQQSGYGSSSSSGHGGGGSGSYGRRKRSARATTNFYDFQINPYLTYPSVGRLITNDETYYSYSPSYHTPGEPPYSLHLANPIVIDGLVAAATTSNNAQSLVFRAYTAQTPYFGLNGSAYNDHPHNNNNNNNNNNDHPHNNNNKNTNTSFNYVNDQ